MKLELLLKEIHPIACNKVNPVAEITGICYDSRTVVPGAMFVAIRGFHTDGHKYIDQALEMCIRDRSIESSKLKSQLSDYQNEEVVLRAQQEKLYNLADIENYVQNELGFSQMGQDQVSYVELSNPDTVIRMEAPSQDSYLLSGLLKSFNAVVEYLN